MIDWWLAESGWHRFRKRAELLPRGCLVDLARHLKSFRVNRSVATSDPQMGLYLVVPTCRLAHGSIMVRIVRWSRGRGRMPILSDLVYAFRMVNCGIHWTPGSRCLVRQILPGLLHRLFLVCLLRWLDFPLGARVNTCQVYPQALSNTG